MCGDSTLKYSDSLKDESSAAGWIRLSTDNTLNAAVFT